MVTIDENLDSSLIVKALSGEVRLQNASGESAALVEGAKLQLGDLLVTEPGAQVELTLPDGNTVKVGGTAEAIFSVDNTVLDIQSNPADHAIALETVSDLLGLCHVDAASDSVSDLSKLAGQINNITG